MKLTRILHTSVNVKDRFLECDGFYREFLGLLPATRPQIPGVDGAWFSIEDTQVHLVDSTQAPGGINPTGPHVCFGVSDLEAAKRELDDRNIPFFAAMQHKVSFTDPATDEIRVRDVEQIWFVDPAGNTIELQEDRRP